MVNKNMNKYRDAWVKAIRAYMQENNVKQGEIAKILGRGRTHFNGILTGRPDRPLTTSMIFESIKRGLVRVKDIYQKDADNQKEVDFWAECTVAQQRDIIRLLGKAQQAGKVDLYIQMLKELISNG